MTALPYDRIPLTFVRRNRRAQDRVTGWFPVCLQLGQGNQSRTLTAIAQNISPGGVYLEIPLRLECGSSLATIAHLPSGARLAAKGLVLRSSELPNGQFGIAIRFNHPKLTPSRLLS
jgi:hypothetical protein